MSTRTAKALWALLFVTALMVVIAAFPVPALTQDKPADNMQILRDKLKADKKLVVATNMELTESEAKGFWPVYELYQNEREKYPAMKSFYQHLALENCGRDAWWWYRNLGDSEVELTGEDAGRADKAYRPFGQ